MCMVECVEFVGEDFEVVIFDSDDFVSIYSSFGSIENIVYIYDIVMECGE